MVVPLIMGAALLDVKKFKEVSDLEALNTEERVDAIMADLQKDLIVSKSEFNTVRMAMISKEGSWEFFKTKVSKNNGEGAIGRESELRKGFSDDLDTRITASTKEQILSHDLAKVRPLTSIPMSVLIAGFLAAFLTGLFACSWMIKLVKKSQLKYFAFYCFLVGVSAIVYSLI
ncbi:MAG: undecaprenyl-diphosphate phosphatase [Flavobacteriales bacterium]|nr:undecaprenyl-diphosphate phosphatase [Flavobacteriales bacterium]